MRCPKCDPRYKGQKEYSYRGLLQHLPKCHGVSYSEARTIIRAEVK